MCAIAVSGRCGSMSATRSPRPTPSAASALARRFARCSMSQYVHAAVAPDSSSQYIAKRARSRAQRVLHACAMLNDAGTFQRNAPRISAYRSTIRREDTSAPAPRAC
jgi:hypothetical protein